MEKTYHLNLIGNKNKIKFLNNIYLECQKVAEYILEYIKKNNEFRMPKIHQDTYFELRKMYPNLNSKLIQQIRDKVLASIKAKKLHKTKKIRVPIIIDYQNFNLKFEEDRFFNSFLRFFRVNFPLQGKRVIEKLKKANKIKRIELIPKDKGRYFKVFFNCEVDFEENQFESKVGLDMNLNNLTLSNGKRFNLKPYVHKKLNYRKYKKQLFIEKWSKGQVRRISSDISKYLLENQVGYLIVEDLKNIRQGASKKKGTSKGKHLNYLLNNAFPYAMFSTFLEDSCSNLGILVQRINPAYTSRTCSRCGSRNTSRPKRDLFLCHDCNLKQNADLNGAKNILAFSSKNSVKSEDRELSSLNKTFKSPMLEAALL